MVKFISTVGKAHIIALAKRMKCRIKYVENRGAEFRAAPYLKSRVISIPHCNKKINYFIAMHELGHCATKIAMKKCQGIALSDWVVYLTCLLPNQEMRNIFVSNKSHMVRFFILAEEFAAWQWALENSLFVPSEMVKNSIRACLRGYWKDYGFIKKDHACWAKLGVATSITPPTSGAYIISKSYIKTVAKQLESYCN